MCKKMIYVLIILLVTLGCQFSYASDKSNQDFKDKEYQELEEELKHLMEEMNRLEKEAKETIRKKILPLLKQEIEKLRKWLREFRLEEDEQGPLKTHTYFSLNRQNGNSNTYSAILPGLFSLLAANHNVFFLSSEEMGSKGFQSGERIIALSALYSISPDSLNDPRSGFAL